MEDSEENLMEIDYEKYQSQPHPGNQPQSFHDHYDPNDEEHYQHYQQFSFSQQQSRPQAFQTSASMNIPINLAQQQRKHNHPKRREVAIEKYEYFNSQNLLLLMKLTNSKEYKQDPRTHNLYEQLNHYFYASDF